MKSDGSVNQKRGFKYRFFDFIVSYESGLNVKMSVKIVFLNFPAYFQISCVVTRDDELLIKSMSSSGLLMSKS